METPEQDDARRQVLIVEDDEAMAVALRDGFEYEANCRPDGTGASE